MAGRPHFAEGAKMTEPDSPIKGVATFVAAGVPFAVSIAGLIGLTREGALSRVMASEGTNFGWAVILVLIAVLAGSLAIILRALPAIAAPLAGFGLLLLTGGVVWLVYLQVSVTKASDAPTVSVSVSRNDAGLIAKPTIKAGEISSGQYVNVKVIGSRAALKTANPPLRPTVADPGSIWDYNVETLYDSIVGPSPEGNLDVTFEVPFKDQYTQITVYAEYVDSAKTASVEVTNASLEQASGEIVIRLDKALPEADRLPPSFDCGSLDSTRGCATVSLIHLYAPS